MADSANCDLIDEVLREGEFYTGMALMRCIALRCVVSFDCSLRASAVSLLSPPGRTGSESWDKLEFAVPAALLENAARALHTSRICHVTASPSGREVFTLHSKHSGRRSEVGSVAHAGLGVGSAQCVVLPHHCSCASFASQAMTRPTNERFFCEHMLAVRLGMQLKGAVADVQVADGELWEWMCPEASTELAEWQQTDA